MPGPVWSADLAARLPTHGRVAGSVGLAAGPVDHASAREAPEETSANASWAQHLDARAHVAPAPVQRAAARVLNSAMGNRPPAHIRSWE